MRLALIDNNVLKELNNRMGTTANVIQEFRIDGEYFGKEFGGQPRPSVHIRAPGGRGVHGNIFWTHNNSVFSARSFFQVGSVQPARTNDYGFTVAFPLWKGARFTVNGSQRRLRGQVNGNILVPAADEREPLTNDPRIRPIVEQILSAYPDELPNRTDINPRALNTNAPQNIDNDRIGGTLDQNLGAKDRLLLRYNYTRQKVNAFQLVGGQNPDTTTRNHAARITWTRVWTATTTTNFSIGFDRVGSLLVPDETSLGPWYRTGRDLTSLGPPARFPVDRAQNLFRYAAQLQHSRRNHNLNFGFELVRRQINGSEVQQHRGIFAFSRDAQFDAVTKLLRGEPNTYQVAVGDVHRGFRNWLPKFYVGDTWKATPNLTVTMGLRYAPAQAPNEVDDLTLINFASDWNNFAPRLGLAYRLPGEWGVLRASYGLHYGQIFPATFMQARFNPPANITVFVPKPDLADPLKDLDEGDLDPGARSTIYQIASELRTPYSHLYNFSWERGLGGDWTLELAYLGSRSLKLLTMWHLNRARPVEGIPQTLRTVNDRRPDQRYFEVQHVLNGSRGYFDAARVTLRLPRKAGFTVDGSYWFSKALDLGADYTGTAANADRIRNQSPSEFAYQQEMKGPSRFDQRHATLWRVNYETPALAAEAPWVREVFGRWQVSSVILLKSGTPFRVSAGSDNRGFGNVDGSGSDSALLLEPSILGRSVDHPDTSAASLPKEAFGFIEPTDPRGNLGRNTFRKDGIANINMGLSRRWTLAAEKTLLLRAEGLNLFNHPQFAEPGSSLTSRDFGVITNTLNDGRTFRFTLQFNF